MTDPRPLVIHVVPADLPRGAQRRAQLLRLVLDGEHFTHRLLSIFDVTEPAELVDASLSVRAMRRSRFLSPIAALRLRRFVTDQRPIVMIAYGSEALRYCALVKPISVRLIYSKTGVADDMGPFRLRVHRWLAARADHVAAVSTATACEAASLLRIPRDRITMVSNGRDPDAFHPPDSRAPGPTRLIWIGHFTPGKRPDLFIDVIEELRDRGHDLDALMIGDGPMLDALRSRASDEDVELLGRRHDVAELLRGADIFVLTGDRDGEGLPGVLIEASLTGLPIVTTDVPGARDVVDDGTSGFVVTARTPVALADAAGRLIQDGSLRSSMGAEGRRRSEESFTLAATADRWRTLLTAVSSA